MNNDLISRSALKKSIKSYADDQYAENEYLGEYAIMDIIDNAPTVDCYTFTQVKKLFDLNVQMADEIENLKRSQGEWITKGQDIYCSICNQESAYNEFGASKFSKFCPNCGADMRGDWRFMDEST